MNIYALVYLHQNSQPSLFCLACKYILDLRHGKITLVRSDEAGSERLLTYYNQLLPEILIIIY